MANYYLRIASKEEPKITEWLPAQNRGDIVIAFYGDNVILRQLGTPSVQLTFPEEICFDSAIYLSYRKRQASFIATNEQLRDGDVSVFLSQFGVAVNSRRHKNGNIWL